MKRYRLLIAVTTALAVAGCATGQVSPSTPQATTPPTALPSVSPVNVSAGTATLSTEECTFQPAATMPVGGFTIDVVNTTDDDAGFDLYRLHADATYADWVGGNEAGQADFDAGVEHHGGPDEIADPVDLQEAVGPNGAGVVVARGGEPGVYALQCWRFPVVGTMRLMSAGPIPIGPQGAVALTVTLTDEACEMDPARPTLGKGPVEIAFVNASSDPGWFGLHRISDGHTYGDLDDYIRAERARAAAGDEPLGPPPWVTITVIREPLAGSTVSLQTTLADGTHAIVCGRVDPASGLVISGPYLVGPLGGG